MTAAVTVPPVRVVETVTSCAVTATRAAENIRRSPTVILSKIVSSAVGKFWNRRVLAFENCKLSAMLNVYVPEKSVT